MSTSNHVTVIPVLGDNFSYLYRYDENNAVAFDCGDCGCLLHVLKKTNLQLSAVLVTHKHFDHTGGIEELQKATGCAVISSDAKGIPATDRGVSDGDVLSFGNEKILVIATPGHTASSVCFYRHPSERDEQGYLFTGDTLFAGGCGRVFECSYAVMYQSLQKLAALPDDTLVYPGHDYTLENYQFAAGSEYSTEIIKQRLTDIELLQKQGKPTIPSTIEVERKTNVFLLAKDDKDFAALRKRKDAY